MALDSLSALLAEPETQCVLGVEGGSIFLAKSVAVRHAVASAEESYEGGDAVELALDQQPGQLVRVARDGDVAGAHEFEDGAEVFRAAVNEDRLKGHPVDISAATATCITGATSPAAATAAFTPAVDEVEPSLEVRLWDLQQGRPRCGEELAADRQRHRFRPDGGGRCPPLPLD